MASVSTSSANIIKELDELLKEYINDVGYHIEPFEIYARPRDANNPIDGVWEMGLGLYDLYNALLSHYQGDDDYDDYEYRNLAHALSSGEVRVEYDYQYERLRETGWTKEETEEKIETIVLDHRKFSIEDIARQLDKELERGITSATSHEKQYDLKFEAQLKRLKKLAGIL